MGTSRDKIQVAEVAGRQFGRISRAQLRELGAENVAVARWIKEGYLHRVLPHVYAVGHQARTIEADLAAALLYAAPGAALSHASAAWWLGLIEDRPSGIQVTTPRKCRSVRGLRVYDRRTRTRIVHRGLATTTVAEALVDLSGTSPFWKIRKALANAEYRKVLDIAAVEAAIRAGRTDSRKLRAALAAHQPSLALTKSRLEIMIVEICEQEGIPLPEINAPVGEGWTVDALWREAKLAVELDGHGNHHTPAQLRRDRRKEMFLRTIGLTPIRYSEDQLKERTQVVAELRLQTIPGPP